jgi:uncharacterized protein (TIGR02246 family)
MDPMTDRERLMRDYLAAWNTRDADRVAAFFSDDAVYADHGAGETAHGRAAIRSHVAAVHRGFPDLESSYSEPRTARTSPRASGGPG